MEALARMIGVHRRAGPAPEGDRSARARAAIVVLAVALAVVALFSLTAGASDASAWDVVTGWLDADGSALSARDRIIVHDIRLPRVALGILIGAALAVSGAVMQGLFRNPLADPGLVGVSAGAGLGAITVIVLGSTVLGPLVALAGIYALPLAAFAGGLAPRAMAAPPSPPCCSPASRSAPWPARSRACWSMSPTTASCAT
jgi:iron complex transport system permease protein